MKIRSSIPVLVLALLVFGGVIAVSPADAQCLSRTECDSLRAQLRAFKDEIRPMRDQLRDLRQMIRDLPQESPERSALRQQARELKRELTQLRRNEIRPSLRRYRSSCKNC
ncbi:MAG: hypothetical protein OEM62_08485 [Acidobacteriota bacterium]|nr:hypothetical protein [Acidobacteriota bacterium]